jgi:phage shock protein PspC (stress-responsive transcriptional regulator)
MLDAMSGETQTEGSKPHSGFVETIKDFWASRPRRPHADRKIAGVAAAIGHRYGIDPVVVRVALVVATIFGGVGLLLYVLGWLFFPDERDQVSAFESMIGRGRSSSSTHFTVLLCIALIPISSWAFAGGWFSTGWFDGGGFIGLALLLAALYLLHRSRGQYNRPVAPADAHAFGPGGFDAAFSMTEAHQTTTDPNSPPAWDPLGAAPLAWDLPDPQTAPSPAPPPPPRRPVRRNKTVGVATFGIALLVAGAGVALNLSGDNWFSVQHVIGMTLGVLGIGLVVGSFVRGGRGLIALAFPLSIAGLVLTAIPFSVPAGGVGDLSATPVTAAGVLPVYQHAVGDINVDLTKLNSDAPVTTKLSNGAGDSTVLVSPTADVRYTCETNAGDVNCFNRHQSGVRTGPVTGEDFGIDGPGGQSITLTVKNSVGSVEVRRG